MSSGNPRIVVVFLKKNFENDKRAQLATWRKDKNFS